MFTCSHILSLSHCLHQYLSHTYFYKWTSQIRIRLLLSIVCDFSDRTAVIPTRECVSLYIYKINIRSLFFFSRRFISFIKIFHISIRSSVIAESLRTQPISFILFFDNWFWVQKEIKLNKSWTVLPIHFSIQVINIIFARSCCCCFFSSCSKYTYKVVCARDFDHLVF